MPRVTLDVPMQLPAYFYGQRDAIAREYVGNRCVKCGVLGSCADWKIDYSPTDELLNSA